MRNHPRHRDEIREICVYEYAYEYGKVPPITYSYTRISSFLSCWDKSESLLSGIYAGTRISPAVGLRLEIDS